MKKLSFYTLILLNLLLNTSCLKQDLTDDFSGYDPIVQMDSVSYPGDGTAGFYGHIVRKGTTDIEALGFFYSKDDYVDELSNQILVNPTNGNFEAWVDGLTPDSIYTVGCFAANDYASSKSSIQTKVKFPEPVVAPCNLPSSTFFFNGDNTTTYSEFGSVQNDGYEIEMSSKTVMNGDITLTIMFNSKPLNGVYTINSFGYSNGNKKAVDMKILFGNQYYFFEDGDKIYVEQLSTSVDSYKVTFCNATFKFFSTSLVCRANFVTQ